MEILVVANDLKMAGEVRAAMYREQHTDIAHWLESLGFQGGLPYRELKFDDFIVSRDYDDKSVIDAVIRSLEIAGHNVVYEDIADMRRVVRAMASGKFDGVLNYSEGLDLIGAERECTIARIAEQLRLNHTGSQPHVAENIFDKHKMAQILGHHGIPTPKTVSVVRADQYTGRFPVFVKPQFAGSGVGIDKDCVVENRERLEEIVDRKVRECLMPVTVQPLIKNAVEYTVAIIPYQGRTIVFPPMIVHSKGPYGANEKWDPTISKAVEYSFESDPRRCREGMGLALRAYNTLGIKGFARCDQMRNGRLQVIEFNQPAGLNPGHIDIGQTEHDWQAVLADDKMSDFPKVILASVHNPGYKGLELPRELGSYVGIVDAIAHGGTQYVRR